MSESEFDKRWKAGAYAGQALPYGSTIQVCTKKGEESIKGIVESIISLGPDPEFIVLASQADGTYGVRIRQSEIIMIDRVGVNSESANMKDMLLADAIIRSQKK